MFSKKKMIKGILVTFITLLFMYLAVSFYFMNRFYFGSQVNNISVAGKTVEEANKKLSNEISSYKIKIIGRNNKVEEIAGKDFEITYMSEGKIREMKENQNAFGWITCLFKDNNSDVTGMISYNENLLKKCVDNLSFFNEKDIIEPENAKFVYEDNKYSIVEEVKGTRVDKEVFNKKIKEAILNGDSILDLDKDECYISPEYTMKSEKTLDLKKKLDTIVGTSITYNFGEKQEVVNGDIICDWIVMDENNNVEINEEKVEMYVDNLAIKYNTVGISRQFYTSYGSTINVVGGNYGRAIDKESEKEYLLDNIKKGKVETKEPEYYQKSYYNGSDDIGDTYVEVSLINQHIWFYKDGNLIVDGDIVTGNVSSGCSTPPGTYRLNYKEKNAILRGDDYETPVSFWMPFNGGIGIHDATWRGAFGGNIYQGNGSHGCVNAPYYVAETIFNNIEPGMPIVCY